jgi:hypothetical protein
VYRERFGSDITAPADLEKLGRSLPPDPYAEGWVMGADGVVRSNTRELELAYEARSAERSLLQRR